MSEEMAVPPNVTDPNAPVGVEPTVNGGSPMKDKNRKRLMTMQLDENN
jgi:hypothetical protein